MTKLVSRFLKDESGATAIEYGLIAALISVALITGAGALGSKLNIMFNNLSNTIANKTPAAP
ncbi:MULTISPECIES: Flp family type IVb pilin [unclassified Rhizobium]|uniref:Flp family type IVb pilin n=1 Tax=unclassified Rhizobium TaxID=2613769 RepID=UPI001ADA7A70|nr:MULTISPECIES: Flp family type IVb pilin [unclassified Rhizobium]MBO9122176.1 Flp family type IVb pilin [Rhizobium sp. 16-488-2b]MBO9172754.1 Flp family type IVb pilin [Rhizobium sp. 16-488-2a]